MKLTRPKLAGYTILAGALLGVVYGLKKKSAAPPAQVSAGMRVGPTKALVGGSVTVG